MRAFTCCFTGHRYMPASETSEILKKTEALILSLLAEGVRFYGVGGALGFDSSVAQLLFRLRDTQFPQIKVILVYPFDGFTDFWSAEQKSTYLDLLPQYDKRVCISQNSCRDAYLIRNRHLVNHSKYCICYCNRREGGTAYTVRYAKKCGLHIFNVGSYDLSEI